MCVGDSQRLHWISEKDTNLVQERVRWLVQEALWLSRVWGTRIHKNKPTNTDQTLWFCRTRMLWDSPLCTKLLKCDTDTQENYKHVDTSDSWFGISTSQPSFGHNLPAIMTGSKSWDTDEMSYVWKCLHYSRHSAWLLTNCAVNISYCQRSVSYPLTNESHVVQNHAYQVLLKPT